NQGAPEEEALLNALTSLLKIRLTVRNDPNTDAVAALREMAVTLRKLRDAHESRGAHDDAALVDDIAVFAKGAQWAATYETDGKQTDPALIDKATSRVLERLMALTADRSVRWPAKR